MRQAHEFPEVGSWYWDVDHGDRFEVVAIDKDKNIEIQYFSGEIEELDEDTWFELRVVSIAPPKDWSGPFDDVEKDEYPTDETLHPRNQSPLNRM